MRCGCAQLNYNLEIYKEEKGMKRVLGGSTLKSSFAVGLLTLLLIICSQVESLSSDNKLVNLIRTPNGGIQPQGIMDDQGNLHLIYFSGDPVAGDIFYVRRDSGKNNFSLPLQINSQPGSAIAIGTIRGAQLSIGKGGRVHVAWNGSRKAEPRGPDNESPMLYSRLNEGKTAFETQRNVMQFSGGLDGGGSVAADVKGNVFVVWHGKGKLEGEAHRRVWVARSTDEGKTFAREVAAYNEETGACGCCGMRAFVDRQGNLQMLYRAATEMVNRDMIWLSSTDQGKSFRGARVDKWKLSTCPMSSAAIDNGFNETLLAWETEGQVYYQTVNSSKPIAAPGNSEIRKHPAVTANKGGQTILIWTEGTGWKKGGSLAWQVYDKNGMPTTERGEIPGVPVWGLATVFAEKGGRFTIIY
jgi:hypothetical protein